MERTGVGGRDAADTLHNGLWVEAGDRRKLLLIPCLLRFGFPADGNGNSLPLSATLSLGHTKAEGKGDEPADSFRMEARHRSDVPQYA